MSRILYDAVIRALKEAHEAYLNQDSEKYREGLKVAECGIEAIRLLGTEDDYGRKMELMGLQAELTLMQSLSDIHNPAESILRYEAAILQMLMLPSQVISKEAPMLPHCKSALDFFGGACEQTAKDLALATDLYGRLTGGGGGVAEIYRAQLAEHLGQDAEAKRWAEIALQKMCGDTWIEAIANKMIKESR